MLRLPRAPSRAQPLSGGASLVARGRHGLGARGHGGGVGPGAAGGGASADGGTDAGAAARPPAMAPPRAGGSHLPSALPSPPDARRALPFHRPARPPAWAATCGRPSRMHARRSARVAPEAAPLCPAAAVLVPPLAFTCAAGLGKVPVDSNTWVGETCTQLPERLLLALFRVRLGSAYREHVRCLPLKQLKSRRVPAGWAFS